jgi:hypothetical protein
LLGGDKDKGYAMRIYQNHWLAAKALVAALSLISSASVVLAANPICCGNPVTGSRQPTGGPTAPLLEPQLVPPAIGTVPLRQCHGVFFSERANAWFSVDCLVPASQAKPGVYLTAEIPGVGTARVWIVEAYASPKLTAPTIPSAPDKESSPSDSKPGLTSFKLPGVRAPALVENATQPPKQSPSGTQRLMPVAANEARRGELPNAVSESSAELDIQRQIFEGRAKLLAGEHRAARAVLERALARDRESATAWSLRAIACLNLGDAAAAERSVGEVRRIIATQQVQRVEMYQALSRIQGTTRSLFERLLSRG